MSPRFWDVQAFQFKGEEIQEEEDRKVRQKMAATMLMAAIRLMAAPIKIKFVHSVEADFWLIKYDLGGVKKIEENLALFTTPLLEEMVTKSQLIPSQKTVEEWKCQRALGLVSWGREYILNL